MASAAVACNGDDGGANPDAQVLTDAAADSGIDADLTDAAGTTELEGSWEACESVAGTGSSTLDRASFTLGHARLTRRYFNAENCDESAQMHDLVLKGTYQLGALDPASQTRNLDLVQTDYFAIPKNDDAATRLKQECQLLIFATNIPTQLAGQVCNPGESPRFANGSIWKSIAQITGSDTLLLGNSYAILQAPGEVPGDPYPTILNTDRVYRRR